MSRTIQIRILNSILAICLCMFCKDLYAQGRTRPNIILILADDLGYGDLGLYGGDAPAPNLAKMAQEGMLFTDFHSNGAVCSPTRAALLTGRYQQRMGVEKALGENEKGLGDEKARGEVTIARYLHDAGYYTGIAGKWHLGYTPDQSPVNYGFDEFWGTLHGAGDYHSRINTFGKYDWWHNKEPLKEDGYSTDLITKHSLEFIEAHKQAPFFLFMSHKAIHFPWQTPTDTIFRKEGFRYRDVQGPLSRLGQHPPAESREAILEMIAQMDKSVGEIFAKLKELKLDRNTLVFFCSDNGGIVKYNGGYTNISSNKPFRGEKGQVYEGGQRVPAIAWWPGRIRQGSVSGESVMTMDLVPTILALAGAATPGKHLVNRLDGVSISSLLFHNQRLKERKLFWKQGKAYAVRSGVWKLVINDANASPELYNLKDDISESKDLSANNPRLVKELIAELELWKRDVYTNKPPAVNDPMSSLMLAGDWVPDDTHKIDFDKLPRVPGNFRVVNDVRKTNGVNQHNYLAFYAGKFWIMWSDGPGVEDRVGQRVKFATSDDGLNWTKPEYMTPAPPGAGEAALYATRTNKGFRYIARGFWKRGDDLIALVSLDEAAEFFGPGLELHGFRFSEADKAWKDIGVIADDAINNFPPEKLTTGEWMMTRRKYGYKKTGVEFLIGGVDSITSWKSFPVFGSMEGLSAEEPDWWVLPDGNLVALFRDNLRSGFLYRSFSSDNGRTWSKPMRTNFPDARSKFSGTRLKDGRYALVSNANPAKRDPLVLSISDDGIVFNKMYYLTGGRHIDYPHIIEHDGYLLIAFSGEKQSVEVMKIRLADIDRLQMISQRR